MSKSSKNNNNKISLNIKGRASALLPNPTNLLNRRRQIKSKTIKNELPDTLINPSSSIKQPEKLFNIRKSKKRMTQLEKNIDLPDTLLAMDEYKQMNFQTDTHISRKLRASCLNPDLPDFLEPVEEIITSNLPKPYDVREENEEDSSHIINSLNEELKLLEEKRKEIEEEKRKLEEEKILFEEKRKLNEEEKKLAEEKINEEKNKIQLEYEKLMKEKKIEEEKILEANNKLKIEQDKLINDQKELEENQKILQEEQKKAEIEK